VGTWGTKRTAAGVEGVEGSPRNKNEARTCRRTFLLYSPGLLGVSKVRPSGKQERQEGVFWGTTSKKTEKSGNEKGGGVGYGFQNDDETNELSSGKHHLPLVWGWWWLFLFWVLWGLWVVVFCGFWVLSVGWGGWKMWVWLVVGCCFVVGTFLVFARGVRNLAEKKNPAKVGKKSRAPVTGASTQRGQKKKCGKGALQPRSLGGGSLFRCIDWDMKKRKGNLLSELKKKRHTRHCLN